MKRPNITPGVWHVAGRADIWAGSLGLTLLLECDDTDSEVTREDALMMAAAPDMFDAIDCMLAELEGRGIHLDNTTRAIQSLVKAGGQFHEGGRTHRHQRNARTNRNGSKRSEIAKNER